MKILNPTALAIVLTAAVSATAVSAQTSTRSAETLLADYGSAEPARGAGVRMVSAPARSGAGSATGTRGAVGSSCRGVRSSAQGGW